MELNGVQEVAGSNPVAPTIYCHKGVKITLVFSTPLFSRLSLISQPTSIIPATSLKLLEH
jgi:hypothetical protein